MQSPRDGLPEASPHNAEGTAHMKPNSERKRRKASTDTSASVIWWSDQRLRELEALARDFQRRGMSRQVAHIEAYRQMIRERRQAAAGESPGASGSAA